MNLTTTMQRPSQHIGKTNSRRANSRRGIATIWVIVSMPALLTLLVVLIDVANVWLAKIELKNALDAAALSGAKSWGEGSTTLQARTDANDVFATNTILGQTSTLSIAEGGCTNNNVTSTGEIVLGVVTDNLGVMTFDCNTAPCPTFSVTLQVNTADTFVDSSSFRITSFTGPAGSTLDQVVVNLAAMMVNEGAGSVADNGFFDFRTAGADTGFGLAANVVTGASTGGAAITTTDAAGATQTSLTVNFSGLNPGDTLFFGADTDQVGPVEAANDELDQGGHFGSGYTNGSGFTTVTGAQVTVTVNGQAAVGTLTFVNATTSTVTIVGSLNSTSAFGIRTRKTVQISSISPTFFGLTIGPYNVSAESFARFQCTGGVPQLIKQDVVSCVCP